MGSSRATDFSFIRRIGRGGFGEVYEARRINTDEVVALKVLDKRKLKKELYRKVCNEIEIHKSLNYPSIVKMYEWFEDTNFMYLVLEYCPNGDLHHFLKNRGKPLPEQEARELFAQLVDGIIHLHTNNIVHRDISLNNLLLTKELTLKISDFGLAKRLSGPLDTHRTMCGTPNFMSPETLSNAGRGFMGDCWSLGCVLYHLLTGELPFEDTGVNEILRRVKEGKLHLPRSISVDAKSLIGLLLQADPNNRVSAREILKHSFMLPANLAVFSGESADSGHGTLDSNEFSAQNDLSDDELKVNQFLPSFSPLPSQQRPHSTPNTKTYLPAIRNALRLRTRPATTPPSPGPLKIPHRPDTHTSLSNRTKPPCLTTTRLPPRLQQRKGLEVEICKSGSICLRRKLDNTGTEEFKVSGNGKDITVSSESARPLTMSYSTLQPRWYTRYAKLVHCVDALKASTPKITIHAAHASAYFMENGPEPNFQVSFKDGCKLTRDKTRCHLTDTNKRVYLATQHMTSCLDMPSDMQPYLEQARALYKQCLAVEHCLSNIEPGVVFPVRMGLPPKTHGNSSFSSTTTDSTQSTSYLSNMPYSMASSTAGLSNIPVVCSAGNSQAGSQHVDSSSKFMYDSSRCSGQAPRHLTSTPVLDYTGISRSPSVGTLNTSVPRSPLTPIQCRRAMSESPPSRKQVPCSENKENVNNNTTLQNEDEYIKYKPGVGWLGFANGQAKLKFKDETELILQDNGDVLVKSAEGQIIRADLTVQKQNEDNIIELRKLRLRNKL